jgi:hypothetical protein
VRAPINPKTGFAATSVDRRNGSEVLNEAAGVKSPTGNELPAGGLAGSIDFAVFVLLILQDECLQISESIQRITVFQLRN